jgi:hypothetical protein
MIKTVTFFVLIAWIRPFTKGKLGKTEETSLMPGTPHSEALEGTVHNYSDLLNVVSKFSFKFFFFFLKRLNRFGFFSFFLFLVIHSTLTVLVFWFIFARTSNILSNYLGYYQFCIQTIFFLINFITKSFWFSN